ncbi:MAG: hypothetical protein PSW75_03405, partial [bacterium]|nr:hypothetical protein [bacterium]
GSAAVDLVPAALATLAGWTPASALALAGLALARSVPTVLIVRTYLRTRKGLSAGAFPALAAVTLALVFIGALSHWQLVPPVAIVLGVLLWARGCWLVSAFRPTWSARRVGLLEAGLGTIQVGALAAAYTGFHP